MENPMIILRCKACGAFCIPPKYCCPKCPNGILEEYKAQGIGEVYSFTTICVPPEAFKDQAPYDIALIELKEGAKVTARMKNSKDTGLRIGMKVRFSGKDATGYWFELEDDKRDNLNK